MAVDLGDLIESLRREVSAPGAEETTFPNASDDTFFGHLQDAFWEMWIESGLLGDYTEVDGLVTHVNGGADLGRGLQQLVVLYAGIRIMRNELRSMNTMFRAKGGPVEYETQKSAAVLKAVYDDLVNRRNYVLVALGDVGAVNTYYIDAVMERDSNLGYGDGTWWG